MTREKDWDIPARELMIPARAFRAGTLCRDVLDHLPGNADIPAIAVVDDGGEVIGLIGRERCLAQMPSPDSYPRRPIEALVDSVPLVVDIDDPIDAISARLAHHAGALTDGFAITEAGRYAGLGRAADLLALSVAQGLRRNVLLKAARDQAGEAERLRASFQHLERLFADLLVRLQPSASASRRRAGVFRQAVTLHQMAGAMVRAEAIRQAPYA